MQCGLVMTVSFPPKRITVNLAPADIKKELVLLQSLDYALQLTDMEDNMIIIYYDYHIRKVYYNGVVIAYLLP